MKRASLGIEDAEVEGVESFASRVDDYVSGGYGRFQVHERSWLCPDRIRLQQSDGVIFVRESGLNVLSERLEPSRDAESGGIACLSRGSNDLAEAFAEELTENMWSLGQAVPTHEIHEFTKLLAIFFWLRDSAPGQPPAWLNSYDVATVHTPSSVDTLRRQFGDVAHQAAERAVLQESIHTCWVSLYASASSP